MELESARLQRLMALLQGVPPPPSVTIPQITLNEVLKKLKENIDQLVGPNHSGGSNSYDSSVIILSTHLSFNKKCYFAISEPVNSLWKPNASLKEVLNTEWPQVKKIVYHDMQLVSYFLFCVNHGKFILLHCSLLCLILQL